ncbi:fungal-specific transcription factor domain-containing protein [Xylaria arbuscula]|nr:fungal-specific transcription factor domain-containing protein [Xylaria arbuscula]
MEEEQGRGTSVERTSTSSKSQKNDTRPTSVVAGPSAAQSSSKRRRGLGIVTPNACTECRKKRAKCDGQKPCGRCKSQKDTECIYEIPVRQSKENLRHEIETLRKHQRQTDNVISALVQPELWEDVLQRLRNGQSIEVISDWLGGNLPGGAGGLPSYAQPGELTSGMSLAPPLSTYNIAGPIGYGPGAVSHTALQGPIMKQDFDANSPWNFSSQSQSLSQPSTHPDEMQWTSEGPPRSRVGSWLRDQDQAGDSVRYRGVDQVLAPLEPTDTIVPPSTWTSITNDSALVQHLLALYFCWEYPTFASLSKEHFMKDYVHGRHRYCSPILINALLALGCRFSTQPNSRANPNDAKTSGDHFFKETLRLLSRESNSHTLTTIQALGIMSIREASCGRDSEAWYYAGQSIRLCIEMGLHRLNDDGDEDELAVQAATFWGAFALDHAWSLATGSLPQCSWFLQLPPKPAIIDGIEASLWIPYTDDGAPLQRSCEQPSNVRSVYKCFCELSELVHQSLYVLHSPGRPLTSRDLLSIYTQYLNWYDSIPEVLRLGHNFTPAVLFAHMYYHFAILLLFRPLIKLRIIGSGILPRDVCSQAADAIQGLLRSYSQLYTLRRTPSFVPYFLLTSSIMHLAIGAVAPESSPSPTTHSTTSTARPSHHQSNASHGASSPMASGGEDPSSSPSSPMTARLSPKVAAAIKQGIADLAEMAPCHHFAEQALNILRFLAKKWNLDVDVPLQKSQEDVDKLVRPSTSSLNFFIPNISVEDFRCNWPERRQPRPGPRPPYEHASHGGMEGMEGIIQEGRPNDPETPARQSGDRAQPGPSSYVAENPLFWPFPMQGRPMLPEGSKLEEAGFALL